jgi:hypothetical protein
LTGARAALIAAYESLVALYPQRRRWMDRLEAVCVGEVLVEPGWMLRSVLDDDADLFALYRVYPDNRIERDRFIERIELDRYRSAGDDDEVDLCLRASAANDDTCARS